MIYHFGAAESLNEVIILAGGAWVFTGMTLCLSFVFGGDGIRKDCRE